MTTREVIDRYYDCVNRGMWQELLTLFSDDITGDEQLAGHFTSINMLRSAIDGIRDGYQILRMYPEHIVIDGETACVVWRCEAQNSHGIPIAYPSNPSREVIGANYFEVQNGKIVYIRTIHDSLPFQPFVDQRES